ncbi:MAG TPA: O-antigen ligase family protein [Gaiellaceae bacterium]|nr:O-antigen ligase family protein [Gaiellaceae bacterium]
MSARLPRLALSAFVVGLPLHNVAMATLWDAGVRGAALDAVSAWKEVLLAAALGSVLWRQKGLPFKATATDWLALAYAAVVVVYALIPQSVLGGEATTSGVVFGVRHHLTPVAAYFLGRSIGFGRDDLRRVGIVVLAAATAVAAWGLVDVYAVSLQWWRESGVPGWYREQLGLEYRGLSGLPENFVYNPGDERPLRRLVSTFLSPLATAYMLLVALLLATTWQRSRVVSGAMVVLLLGLLFTYSRTAVAALALGLVVLAYALRSWLPVAAAVVLVGIGALFVRSYEDIGPETRFTAAELQYQRAQGQREPTTGNPFDPDESSFASHLDALRGGAQTIADQPWGYGVGNAGVTAFRTGGDVKAGESTYGELGADLGLLGLFAFVAWSLALLWRTLRAAPWLGASLAAVLALGIQTDVIGVHWLAFVLWALAGERA